MSEFSNSDSKKTSSPVMRRKSLSPIKLKRSTRRNAFREQKKILNNIKSTFEKIFVTNEDRDLSLVA